MMVFSHLTKKVISKNINRFLVKIKKNIWALIPIRLAMIFLRLKEFGLL